jgi:hypothetical protein
MKSNWSSKSIDLLEGNVVAILLHLQFDYHMPTLPTLSKCWKDHYGTEIVPLLSNKKGVHQLASKYCSWGNDGTCWTSEAHLGHIPKLSVAPCPAVPDDVKQLFSVSQTAAQPANSSQPAPQQRTLHNSFRSDRIAKAQEAVADFFFKEALPLDLANSLHFANILRAVVEAGAPYSAQSAPVATKIAISQNENIPKNRMNRTKRLLFDHASSPEFCVHLLPTRVSPPVLPSICRQTS